MKLGEIRIASVVLNTHSRIKIYKDTINIYTNKLLLDLLGLSLSLHFPSSTGAGSKHKGLVLQPLEHDPLAALELVLLVGVDLDGIRRPLNPLSRTTVLNSLSLRSSASSVLG